jgi:Protein of unknown function (DUF3800)
LRLGVVIPLNDLPKSLALADPATWHKTPVAFSFREVLIRLTLTRRGCLLARGSFGLLIMPVSFVAYIDESGDTGLESVKPLDVRGASEWLVLSCFLVRAKNDGSLPAWVAEIRSKFKSVQSPHLHYADLIPVKKRIACEMLARNPCRAFVAMSNKKNIQQYRNPNLNPNNKAWIYWWLARLLLERVTRFCAKSVHEKYRGTEKLRIVFSRRTDLKYKDFEEYLWKLRWQSYFGELVLNAGDLSWDVVDFEEIRVLDHAARSGLQLADVVAGAFFKRSREIALLIAILPLRAH